MRCIKPVEMGYLVVIVEQGEPLDAGKIVWSVRVDSCTTILARLTWMLKLLRIRSQHPQKTGKDAQSAYFRSRKYNRYHFSCIATPGIGEQHAPCLDPRFTHISVHRKARRAKVVSAESSWPVQYYNNFIGNCFGGYVLLELGILFCSQECP